MSTADLVQASPTPHSELCSVKFIACQYTYELKLMLQCQHNPSSYQSSPPTELLALLGANQLDPMDLLFSPFTLYSGKKADTMSCKTDLGIIYPTPSKSTGSLTSWGGHSAGRS